jgi:hypothetical protein
MKIEIAEKYLKPRGNIQYFGSKIKLLIAIFDSENKGLKNIPRNH